MIPVLVATQARSVLFYGPGWVTGRLPLAGGVRGREAIGKAAIQRSRDLMTGLRSAGRALAIRHFALAALTLAEVVQSLSFFMRGD